MNVGMFTAKFARLTPRAEAVYDHTANRRLNFAALDELVRRFANGLLALGLAKGDRVAMLSHNSAETLALFFACGRVGLVAQPLNWRLAAPELIRIAHDSTPSVCISQPGFAETVASLKNAVPSVRAWLEYGGGGDGSFEAFLAAAATDEPASSAAVGDDDPLYILYTGGTTGESKGVLHTHRSTYSSFVNNTAAERVAPTDVYMLTGQMFHSAAVLALTYTAHGRKVVLMNFEPNLAMKLIQEEKVSSFIGITTMVNWMLAVENFDRYDTSSLRHIQYGGGPISSSVVRAAIERFKCSMLGAYGMTEGNTMTFLSYGDHVAALDGIHPERLRSCGREAFNTTIRVADEEGRAVPQDGTTHGEILVQSEANMTGYWGRPDLTAATIRDGWMRTGDVATWDEDGYVFIVDRAKDMIISGGENIYSIQVEEAIYKHPAVLEAAVIGVPDATWGERVKAYVVLKPGMNATAEEIMDVARLHLASYQKPSFVAFLSDLPKAPTGKILKRVLRDASCKDRERNV